MAIPIVPIFRCSRLFPGQRITHLNGQDVSGASLQTIFTLMKGTRIYVVTYSCHSLARARCAFCVSFRSTLVQAKSAWRLNLHMNECFVDLHICAEM